MQDYNFSYDKENDDLFMHKPDSKSKGSIEWGNFIFDFNSKKELVGVQILDASEVIGDIVDSSVKEVLVNLVSCGVEIKPQNNILIIKIHLKSSSKEISPVISVPNLKERSKALVV